MEPSEDAYEDDTRIIANTRGMTMTRETARARGRRWMITFIQQQSPNKAYEDLSCEGSTAKILPQTKLVIAMAGG